MAIQFLDSVRLFAVLLAVILQNASGAFASPFFCTTNMAAMALSFDPLGNGCTQSIPLGGTSCDNSLIGAENKYVIPDSSFKATSSFDKRYAPSSARLNGYNGWGPKTVNPWEYLQIDLGYPYFICAIATQGSSIMDEWVTEYKIKTSTDGTNWMDYQENGQVKLFSGNTDRTSIVKHAIRKPLVRYIRFIPTGYNNWKTMRVGIYGFIEGCENIPLGMESGVIKNSSISASSAQDPARNARLKYSQGSSWCASRSDSSPYLQIDLGELHLICAVATQGNNITDQWVKTYQIKTSSNGATWTTYQENKTDMVFSGNYDRTTVVRHVLFHGLVARYIRIVPKTYQGNAPCLRTEIYGYDVNQTCFSHSTGIPSANVVPNHRFTATSYYNDLHKPYMARLGDSSAWAPKSKDTYDYLQVDFGSVFYICAAATQGNKKGYFEWVRKYELLYSISNNQWTAYRENGTDKEFSGNKDESSIVTDSITMPFKAKFIRVLPTAFSIWKSIRVDFRGLPAGCVSPLGLENGQIPDSQMTSSSTLDNSHTASHGRLYGSSSWCSSTSSNNEYLQVDLGQTKTVTGIATQGDNSLSKWVTSYNISHSFDGKSWSHYSDEQVFNGNSNNTDVVVNWLNSSFVARHVRIYPQTSNNGHCMRLDLYGCTYYIPESQSNQITPDKKSVSLRWTNTQTPHGTANSFVIVLNKNGISIKNYSLDNSKSSLEITELKPYTEYELKTTAMKADGRPLWESTTKFRTRIAVPEGAPIISNLEAKSSQSIELTIRFTQKDLLNGPMVGFRIFYQPEGGSQNQMDVGDITKVTLNGLKKNTVYRISVAVRNSLGVGPSSVWSQKRTREDVPEIGPQETKVAKTSRTSYLVTWQPLTKDQSNGEVTKYEIIWHYVLARPHANSKCQDYSTATTKETQFTLENLRSYAQYTVSVRGYTSIGPGPNRTVRFTTSYVSGIESSNSTQCVSKGVAVTFRCYTINDYGPTKYTWTKNGVDLVDNSAAQVKEDVLTVKPKDEKDFGTYVCTATNSEGTITFMISRIKLTECSISTSAKPKTGQVYLYIIIVLVVIIVALVICIVCLIRRPRSRIREGPSTKEIKGNANQGVVYESIPAQSVPGPSGQPESGDQSNLETYTAINPQPEPEKMAYQSLQGTTSPKDKDATKPEQYMELKDVTPGNVYQGLNPQSRPTIQQSYENIATDA